jgi:hypothetical protein
LWQSWPTLLLKSIQLQRDFNSQLSDLLYDIQEEHQGALLSFSLISFIYGILHSLGPGRETNSGEDQPNHHHRFFFCSGSSRHRFGLDSPLGIQSVHARHSLQGGIRHDGQLFLCITFWSGDDRSINSEDKNPSQCCHGHEPKFANDGKKLSV